MSTPINETLSAEPGQAQIVLIVDDSKVMRLALKKILNTDYKVLEATDGDEAWDAINRNNQIRIVFSDLSMPNLDGYGLLGRVRGSADQRVNELPFIVITGNEDDDGAREKAINMGATDFITKPFKSTEIKARAKAHLGYQEKIQDISSTFEQQIPQDSITGLAKQEYFEKRATQLMSFASRHHSDLSLLMLQLKTNPEIPDPRYKSLLQEIAHVVREYTRNEDLISHYGRGDFRILLPGVDLSGAEKLGSRFEQFVRGFEASNSGDPEIERLVMGASSVDGTEARITLEDLVTIAGKNTSEVVMREDNTQDNLDILPLESEKPVILDFSDMQDDQMDADHDVEHTQFIDMSVLEEALERNEAEANRDTEVTQIFQMDDLESDQGMGSMLDEGEDPSGLEVTSFIDTGTHHEVEHAGLEERMSKARASNEDTVMIRSGSEYNDTDMNKDVEYIPEIKPAEPLSPDKEEALEYANKLKKHIEERAKTIEEERERIRETAKRREQEAEERARKRAEDFARKRVELETSIGEKEYEVDEKETAKIREALKVLREKETIQKSDEGANEGFLSSLFAWIKNLFGKK